MNFIAILESIKDDELLINVSVKFRIIINLRLRFN